MNTSTGSYPPMISNPVSTIDEHTGVIVVYVQASDGQVSTCVHVHVWFVYVYMYMFDLCTCTI